MGLELTTGRGCLGQLWGSSVSLQVVWSRLRGVSVDPMLFSAETSGGNVFRMLFVVEPSVFLVVDELCTGLGVVSVLLCCVAVVCWDEVISVLFNAICIMLEWSELIELDMVVANPYMV